MGCGADFVWGAPAEAAFAALSRRGLGEDDADISYVQIGAVAGPEAAVPSALLCSRHIRITGSGAGSASMAVIRAEIPVHLGLIADGRIDVPVRTFPLPAIGALVGNGQEATRGNGVHQVRDQLMRVVSVGDAVQYRDQHRGGGLAQIQEFGRLGQDLRGHVPERAAGEAPAGP